MNNENNPYESSLAKKITQRAIFALSRVLSQENSVARSIQQTRADLTTGTESLRVTIYLPKRIEITYVQKETKWLNTLPKESLRAQVLEFIRDGIEDVLRQASIKAKAVFTRFNDNTCTAQFEVVLEDLGIVEKELLPRVIEIEYV